MSETHLPLILRTHTLPQSWVTMLEGRCRQVVGPLDATCLAPELEAQLDQAEGLYTLLTIPITEAILQKAPRLRVVSNMAAGVDNIDLAACTRRGIPVGNTPGVLTEGTADLTMALLLAVGRGLILANQDARLGRWKTWSPTGWLGADLSGATLGIIGMGKIGQAVAQRAAGFGMRIVYADSQRSSCDDPNCLPLQDLLQQSDFVSLHVPLTNETRGLINDQTLKLMKPTAILVNAARGPVVDTAALVHALSTGQIAGAALDVTDPEPLPPDHPLYSLPNCLVVPHIGSATQNTRRRMAGLACENLLAGLEGHPLPYCVNPQVYQR
ncbi:MAG TPA: D-glycerate dehydrogenase [Anaerolineales bacterium]|nr:D-glycerate dehydrogenase [Anaerolineales bacterium]